VLKLNFLTRISRGSSLLLQIADALDQDNEFRAELTAGAVLVVVPYINPDSGAYGHDLAKE